MEIHTDRGRPLAVNFNGIGVVFHGRREVEPDGSYVATRWFAFVYFPIVPLGSYRLWHLDDQSVPFGYDRTRLRARRVPLRWGQVLGTYAVAVLAVGIVVGVLWGALSDKLTQRGVPPHLTYFWGCVACTTAMIPIVLGYGSASLLLWSLFMALSPFGTLAYALLAARFPKEMAGRVVTALNMVMFFLAFAIQLGVGAIINLWPVIDGRYAVDGYRAAFALCWLMQVAAMGWLACAERSRLRRRPAL